LPLKAALASDAIETKQLEFLMPGDRIRQLERTDRSQVAESVGILPKAWESVSI
jgi:hypothetical protein